MLDSRSEVRTTLIVAPLALIRQWEAEILSKSSKDALRVLVHYGKGIVKCKVEVIVNVTYHILKNNVFPVTLPLSAAKSFDRYDVGKKSILSPVVLNPYIASLCSKSLRRIKLL